jgi:hypothetical protein
MDRPLSRYVIDQIISSSRELEYTPDLALPVSGIAGAYVNSSLSLLKQ